MSETTISSFVWVPGQGPDPNALDRMARAFPKPKKPMGEAWFLAPEREMYPQLFNDLDTISGDEIETVLVQTATGPSCFGPHEEWTEWYHYLLPRLLEREWGRYLNHPAELMVTSFMAQHPYSDGSLPYPAFQADALATLGRYIMAPHFWLGADSEVPKCFNKWKGPTGICGWYEAEGLLSASLFFCVKYLARDLVGPWFQSVVSIPNMYWQAQVITWLVGAHPILVDEIGQPDQFPEEGRFGVGWNWSHTLDGNYSGSYEPPIRLIPFLPAENREAILHIARGMKTGEFFEELLTDPQLEAVAAETTGLPERFKELYRKGTPVD